MGIETKAGYCNDCDERRKIERKGTNHVLHLILSIVTFGWWIIAWVLVAVSSEPWRCSSCGSKDVKVLK